MQCAGDSDRESSRSSLFGLSSLFRGMSPTGHSKPKTTKPGRNVTLGAHEKTTRRPLQSLQNSRKSEVHQNSENPAEMLRNHPSKCVGNHSFSIISGITRPCCLRIDHLNARSNRPRSAVSAFRWQIRKIPIKPHAKKWPWLHSFLT